MAMLAAGKALGGEDREALVPERTGIIVASGFGAAATTFAFLDSYMDKGDALAFPIHFSNSVHNAAAAHISITYNIQGPNLTVSQFDLSFISALITAQTWLEAGKADSVMVVSSDEYCRVVGYCIEQLGKNGSAYAFSEGAACFLLKKSEPENTSFGWFEMPVMGDYRKDDITIPQGADLIISPSSLECRTDDFMEQLSRKNPQSNYLRHHCFSPTDQALDAAIFSGEQGAACLIKLGQDTRFGQVMHYL